MQRYLSQSKLYVGQLVVVTTINEAQVYTLNNFDKGVATLNYYQGEALCTSIYTSYCLMKPTVAQIEFTLNNYGPLVSKKEIIELTSLTDEA